MPDDDSKPSTLDYASPTAKKPRDPMWKYLEHYLALVGLILVTGIFALLMLALGISAAIAWVHTGASGHLDMNEVKTACFIDLPLGVISAGVCVTAWRKLQQ